MVSVQLVQGRWSGLTRHARMRRRNTRAVALTLRCPRKCCRSLISRKARLAKIFLLKTLVTFLIATPSFVWLFTAALRYGANVNERSRCSGRLRTLRCAASADLPDDTVGTLAQLFGNRVTLIDDKVLVEDFEHLPTL